MVTQNSRGWSTWLGLAEWWYNSHFHTGLQGTPFEMLYSYKPPHLNYHQFGKIHDLSTRQFCKDRTELLQKMKHHLKEAQSRIKQYANRHRTERLFEVGDMVYLKVRPERQTTLAVSNQGKLAPKYFGPFKVEEKIGAVSYILQLPVTARIHPTFHVSLLKKKVGQNCSTSPNLPAMDSWGQLLNESVAVLDRRLVKKGNVPSAEVLVQWANTLPSEATWEEWSQLHQRFPQFVP